MANTSSNAASVARREGKQTRPLLDEVRRRWRALKSEYQGKGWFSHHKECSDYIMPRTGRYFFDEGNRDSEASGRNDNIIDNTATRAARVLGAGLMSGMSSPHQPWVRLQTPVPELNDRHDVRLWLDEVTTRLMRVLSRSNFYRVLHQMYEEIGVYGTAAAVVVPDFDNIMHCHALTAGQYYLATDSKGVVTTLYRELQMTVSQIVREFGFDRCSQSVQSMFREGQLDQWVDVVHAIEPRYDRMFHKIDGPNMPFRSVYFEVGHNEHDAKDVLRNAGFMRFPCVAPRWALTPGDVYGNGPGMEALPDTIQLQDEQFRKGQAIAYLVKPPVQMPSEMKNREKNFDPGGENYVDQTGAQGGIRPVWETRLDLSALLEDINDVRSRINGSFFADLFLMLHSTSGPPQRTATEVAELHAEKLLMLGPVLERLDNELLSPAVDLAFEYMGRAGLIPPAPGDIQGLPLVAEFVSVLAQAQRAAGINSIDRFVASVGAVSQLWPDVLDRLNIDEWVTEMSVRYNTPPKILRDDADVDELRAARAKVATAQAALGAQQQAAATAKDAAMAAAAAPVDPLSMAGGYQTPQGVR